MKLKYSHIIFLLALLISLSSCKKWLDVSPQTQVRERNLLETEQGFKDALTGVYIQMTSGSVYGQNLTMGFMDALGQRYNTASSSHSFYRTARYEYNDAGV